jgi:hypothetical protein
VVMFQLVGVDSSNSLATPQARVFCRLALVNGEM